MLFLDYCKFLVVKVMEGWYYWFSKALIFTLYHQNTLLLLSKPTHKNKSSFLHFYLPQQGPGGGGGEGGYSHTLPIRVCAAQRGRDFEAPGLERGIHFRGVFLEWGIIFRTHESSSFVSSHL